MNKSTRDWRKRSHRLEKARDEFRERNREKAAKIKTLEGRALDLEESRAKWKKKCEEKTHKIKHMTDELAASDALLMAERKLRQAEMAEHAKEMEQLKKKWEMLQQFSQEKKNKKSLADTIRRYLS